MIVGDVRLGDVVVRLRFVLGTVACVVGLGLRLLTLGVKFWTRVP